MSRSPVVQPPPRRLPVRILAAYGAPALPLAALTLPVYIYLPTFYAEGLGLGLSAVGVALLLARVWDVVTDPVIGYASDRLPTRFGRRRPWLLAGMPLVLLAIVMLFLPPPAVTPAWLLGWSLLLTLGWTVMILPLSAWGAELSPDYHERSRVVAWREGFVVVGTVVALGLPVALGLGDADDPGGALALIAWMVILLLPLTVALALWQVPEPAASHPAAPAPARRQRLRAGWRLLAANTPFRRLILAYLINGIANALPATLFLLFVSHRLRAPEAAGLLLFLYFLAGVAAIPLWLGLARRFDKHRIWCAAMLWNCAVFLTVPLLGPGDVGWFLAICLATGACLGADLVLPASMQADVVDRDTLAGGGERRTGLFFALWGMATKLALALAVGLAFPALDLVGFRAEAGTDANTAGALFALAALYALVPVGFKLAAIGLMWGYPITRSDQEATRRAIAAGAAGGPPPHG